MSNKKKKSFNKENLNSVTLNPNGMNNGPIGMEKPSKRPNNSFSRALTELEQRIQNEDIDIDNITDYIDSNTKAQIDDFQDRIDSVYCSSEGNDSRNQDNISSKVSTVSEEFFNTSSKLAKELKDNVVPGNVFTRENYFEDVEKTLDEITDKIEKSVETNVDRNERVDHPDYYNLNNGPFIIIDYVKYPIECIDVIRNMPGWKANAIKYLWRAGEKAEAGLSNTQKEIEDLEKAVWYINDKINELKNISLTKIKSIKE